MSGGQEKNFSTLGPKLRGNKAQQYYGDKQRQICIEMIVYYAFTNLQMRKSPNLLSHTHTDTAFCFVYKEYEARA